MKHIALTILVGVILACVLCSCIDVDYKNRRIARHQFISRLEQRPMNGALKLMELNMFFGLTITGY